MAPALILIACEPTPPAAPAADAAEAITSPELSAAHEHFVRGEAQEMLAALRRFWAGPASSPAQRQNASALLEAAYDRSRGRLRGDWTLPDGISHLSVRSVRAEQPDGVFYQIVVAGHAQAAGTVVQLELRAADGRAVLDRRAKLGKWTVEPEEAVHYFELESDERPRPVPDGLYTIHLELDDGRTAQGWFLLSGLVASASPVIRAPVTGSVVSSRRPELVWETDFRSPQYRAYERRSRGIWVLRLTPQEAPPYRMAWHTWALNPAPTTRQTLGEAPDGLAPGEYWAGISFGERRRFGPLTLVRVSRASRPFSVR